jgi:hypothetical protein
MKRETEIVRELRYREDAVVDHIDVFELARRQAMPRSLEVDVLSNVDWLKRLLAKRVEYGSAS